MHENNGLTKLREINLHNVSSFEQRNLYAGTQTEGKWNGNIRINFEFSRSSNYFSFEFIFLTESALPGSCLVREENFVRVIKLVVFPHMRRWSIGYSEVSYDLVKNAPELSTMSYHLHIIIRLYHRYKGTELKILIWRNSFRFQFEVCIEGQTYLLNDHYPAQLYSELKTIWASLLQFLWTNYTLY